MASVARNSAPPATKYDCLAESWGVERRARACRVGKTVGRVCEAWTTTTAPNVSQVQPIRNSPPREAQTTRQRAAYRPREFLDEREEVRPRGSKDLRRTRSEIQCAPRGVAVGGGHSRSQSAWDFAASRRTPDSGHHSSLSSESGSSSRSLNQSGRVSRLAELPESCGSIIRHSPESRVPDSVPTSRTDLARLIDPQSTNEDVDAAEIQRIQFEQSKKLIPMVQARNTPKGRRSSRSPMTPPLGKRSSGSTAPCVVKCEAHSMAMSLSSNLKNEGLTENGFRDRIPEDKSKEQDRKTFFESLSKNKTMSHKGATDTDSSTPHPVHLLAKGDSSADMSLECSLLVEKKVEEGLIVVPPSVEEERFLRSLGWNGSEEVALLTDEEIAAFKAQYLNKAVEEGESQQTKCKTGHLRSLQSSPVGHFSSFDLVADSRSAFMSSETGYL